MDEGRIRAVLQQAPHQVGQQVAVLAHRGVDPARDGAVLHDLAIDALAHAVQPLHLEGPACGHLHDGGDGAGVVRGELRVDDLGVLQQRLGAGQVGQVGVRLVREDGVSGQAELLRALDLAVPVGALDQTHHETQAVRARDARHLVHHRQRARLVGLHRQAEALPLRKAGRDARGQRVQQFEREFQAVDLLGVDGEVQVRRGGGLDELPHPRLQFGEDALALGFLVAREERAQLDGDAVGRHRRLGALPAGNARDGVGVAGEVAPGVALGARAFAQHVVAETQVRLGLALARGLGPGFIDVAAQHELPAEQLDGAHGGGHHRARAQAPDQAGLGLGAGQEPLRQADRAGRQVGQHAVRAVGGIGVEIGAAELVGRQRDGGLGVGHAQQGLGQPHQGQALRAGDRVLPQQRFHRPERGRMRAYRFHPRAGAGHHARPVQRAGQGSGGRGQGLGFRAVRERQAFAGGGRHGVGLISEDAPA